MNIENILGLCGGGLGVFLLKLYNDVRKTKRGDSKDVVGAWQQIAEREASKIERLEARVAELESEALIREVYIGRLESALNTAGVDLPDRQRAAAARKRSAKDDKRL